jgi:hypothetical protein
VRSGRRPTHASAQSAMWKYCEIMHMARRTG